VKGRERASRDPLAELCGWELREVDVDIEILHSARKLEELVLDVEEEASVSVTTVYAMTFSRSQDLSHIPALQRISIVRLEPISCIGEKEARDVEENTRQNNDLEEAESCTDRLG
jgi:hypothetical protein